MEYYLLSIGHLPEGFIPEYPILEPESDAILVLPGMSFDPPLIGSLLEQGVNRIRVHHADVESLDLPVILWDDNVFDSKHWNHSPEALARFVQQNLSSVRPILDERRAAPRYRITAPVATLPLTEHYRPAGPAFEAVCRDISATGIAVYHTRAVAAKYLLIDLVMPSGKSTRLIAEVVRCRLDGRFYEIAGRFTARYDRQESTTPPPTVGKPRQLPTELRKRIFLQYLLARDRAEQEAARKFPEPSEHKERDAFCKQRFELRSQAIASNYKLTLLAIQEIVKEGHEQGWRTLR